MQERGGVPLEEFKRQRKQKLQNVFRPAGPLRLSSPRKRSTSVTGTSASARARCSSPEVTSRSGPATSARRTRRPNSSRVPDVPVAPGAAEPIDPISACCALDALESPPSSPSSAVTDDDPIPGIMMATMESVRSWPHPRTPWGQAPASAGCILVSPATAKPHHADNPTIASKPALHAPCTHPHPLTSLSLCHIAHLCHRHVRECPSPSFRNTPGADAVVLSSAGHAGADATAAHAAARHAATRRLLCAPADEPAVPHVRRPEHRLHRREPLRRRPH